MYIYNFFKSLNLLRNIPDTSKLPKGNYLYFGVQEKKKLIENGFNLNTSDNYYLAYVEYGDLSSIDFIPVDDLCDYIKKLESELINITTIDNDDLNAALFEVVWLLNEIAYLEKIPFFDAKLDIEVTTLASMIDYNGGEYNHGIDYFDNINLLKRIHLAQVRYFISQYLKAKINTNLSSKDFEMNMFDEIILNVMKRFMRIGPDKYKVELYTNSENSEFDDIIEQIVVLAYKQSNEA